jgi:hypothetical protein
MSGCACRVLNKGQLELAVVTPSVIERFLQANKK